MNTPENDETTTVAACPPLSGGLERLFAEFWDTAGGGDRELAVAAFKFATVKEREACASLAELCDDQESAARFIRARSNEKVRGVA